MIGTLAMASIIAGALSDTSGSVPTGSMLAGRPFRMDGETYDLEEYHLWFVEWKDFSSVDIGMIKHRVSVHNFDKNGDVIYDDIQLVYMNDIEQDFNSIFTRNKIPVMMPRPKNIYYNANLDIYNMEDYNGEYYILFNIKVGLPKKFTWIQARKFIEKPVNDTFSFLAGAYRIRGKKKDVMPAELSSFDPKVISEALNEKELMESLGLEWKPSVDWWEVYEGLCELRKIHGLDDGKFP